MTVRWKPLIVLSGLFLVIAVMGLMVVTLDLVPERASEILPTARAEWKAGRYGNSQIHFLRALQSEPKNGAVYREIAELYLEWSKVEKDPAKRAQLRTERLSALADAAKYSKDPLPRKQLLADAMAHDDPVQSALWAKKLLDLDPNDADAHFALASSGLTGAVDLSEVEKHLLPLETKEPDRLRTDWIRAEIARQRRDTAGLAAALGRSRGSLMATDVEATDRIALIQLRTLDLQATNDPAQLIERATKLREDAERLVGNVDTPATRLVRVAQLVEQAQRQMATIEGMATDPGLKGQLQQGADELEAVAETAFRSALEATATADLNVVLAQAEHLRFRDKIDQCLAAVDRALKSPAAQLPAWADTAARLRAIATKAALSTGAPAKRFGRAEPYIQGLLGSALPEHQAVGHLYQGVLELERSGVADSRQELLTGGPTAEQARLRASALLHLKQAEAGLPGSPPAQALYRVALLLSGEPALGRQHLTAAQRLPDLEPRFQIWTAWAMLQAGYPEEAEPIVRSLQAAAKVGTIDADLTASVHTLAGEVLQSKETPATLQAARDAYQQAAAQGGNDETGVQLRLAEIDVKLGETERALERLNQLRTRNIGGPAAEQMAALIFKQQGKDDESRRTLEAARKRYPDSGELVIADAGLWLQQDQPAQAEKVLAKHLEAHPGQLDVLLFRARVLSEDLEQPDQARALLKSAAEKTETSSPLVQLAMLEIDRQDTKAAAAAITRIRARWKDLATADLLDAQLALQRQDFRAAVACLDTALQKDPTNKVALFWKAQLRDRAGQSAEAMAIYQKLERENPIKELDDGLSLATAASWALANLALENQDVEGAIGRLEGLLKGGLSSNLARPVRWQLVAARVTNGQWPAAKVEIEDLIRNPKTTMQERIRAANYFRLGGEAARALQILDVVLAEAPTESAAVAMKAYLQAEKQPAGAAATLRQAIAKGKQPASIHLMLAAIENMTPPAETGISRAQRVIDAGLVQHPGAIELVEARYRVQLLSGDVDAALRLVEEEAQKDQTGKCRRLLVDLYREQGRIDAAEKVVRGLVVAEPGDATLALTLVAMVAQQASSASERGDRKGEAALNERTASLIKEYRAKFPEDLGFLQAEADLAARGGRLDRAMAISQEIDKIDATSPAGPIIRARLAGVRGWTAGVASAYKEAVDRAPRRGDLRMALGQASLATGQVDEAVQQANWLMENNPGDPGALVLKVRSLQKVTGTPEQVAARQAEAVKLLNEALGRDPRFMVGYHLLAEIEVSRNNHPGAVAILERGLKVDSRDAAGLSQLVALLVEPGKDGSPPAPQNVERAKQVAERLAEGDATGQLALAVSIALHRAGLYELALPWGVKAADREKSWVAYLNLADLYLAKAEATTDTQTGKSLFELAATAYDQVLAQRANQVEAINNKAWILHQYLGRHADAQGLIQGLIDRVDPTTIPPDVYDTLGSIQEAIQRPKEAETSYAKGLERDKAHPALNLHMARLLANDRSREPQARGYLEKAMAAREQLPPALVAELDSLALRLK